ncbi:glycosyltransferase [Tropicimonas sp. IMCC6043]|uniref:glycosyltransferase family 2 protein n=1 Tax=Tropicimonas sp. IMCC6043 TaxID=2510645 RepID=UPI00101C21F5|nr:glycosyltransferase [Tropicimonas sp. IMCC6043]RYH06552.1 glycosyltransferase [Tropicimonas sp. IMCC6043]
MNDAERLVCAIAIGRNEGARLVLCLNSLKPRVTRMIYVDSGSTDGSVEAARAIGAEVVELDMVSPFTAARARNAGFERLRALGLPEFVQFIDGDCEINPGWIEAALAVMEANQKLGVVCGRLSERFPDASIYNRLADAEWDAPVGPVRACGGIALYRTVAFVGAGGFNSRLIAGEEPELCLRIAREGWGIERLAADMAWHDVNMNRFGQWWQRSRRAGFAFAEGAAMYGAAPERYRRTEIRRILIWAAAIPLAILLAAFLAGPWAFLGVLLYPLQVLRLARSVGWERAFFLTLGKFAEFQGVTAYWRRRMTGGRQELIEYK